MSRLNTMTCLVSAGYPVWYAYGVSRGIISVHDGLRTDLVHVSGAPADTGYVIVYYYQKEEEEEPEIEEMPELDINKLEDNAYLNQWLKTSIRVNEKEVLKKVETLEDCEKKNELQSGYEDVFRKNKQNSFALVLVENAIYVGHIFIHCTSMVNMFTLRCIENNDELKKKYDQQKQLFTEYKCKYKDNENILSRLKETHRLFSYIMESSHPKIFSVIGIQKYINSTYKNFVQHMLKGLGLFAERNEIFYVAIEQPLKIMQTKVKKLHDDNILKYEDFSVKSGKYLIFPIYTQENLNTLDNEGLELLNETKIVDQNLSDNTDSKYTKLYEMLVKDRELYESDDIFKDIINEEDKSSDII